MSKVAQKKLGRPKGQKGFGGRPPMVVGVKRVFGAVSLPPEVTYKTQEIAQREGKKNSTVANDVLKKILNIE